jgi:DNA-binding winged helix-turn-helix (wHTH) protein/tetratricopeptide (TPR) repeat protein
MASSARPSALIRFGSFELDAANRILRKAGISLKLHPQPFRVLLLLADRPGQIVDRKEIQKALWGNNTFVDFEGGLNFCIKQIRDTLGDDAENPRYVETLPRRGYRFIAPITYADEREQIIPFPHVPGPLDVVKTSHPPREVVSAARALPDSPLRTLPVVQTGSRKNALRALAFALVLVALVAASATYYFHRQPKFAERDTVVVEDFSNSTGDPVFDDALKQALTVELEQSPFLNLLPDRRAQETLRLMGRSANDRITSDVGREICLRTGSRALLAGAISSLGSHYVVSLSAVACNDGQILAKQQAEATRKEDVLKVLSRAASELRGKLGESLPSVQKFDVPIEVTTTSLDALKNYSMAARMAETKGDAESIPFVKRALAYDPEFAMAYAALARRYVNLDQPSLALENATKAYQLRDRVTEREQLTISVMYFRTRGDLEKLVETFEVWKANYPTDAMPYGSLCASYGFLGQYEKALSQCQEAIRRDPGNVVNYGNLSGVYIDLNRFEEAQKTCEQAEAHRLSCPERYYLDFLRRDFAGMAQQVESVAGQPGTEDFLLAAQSDTEAYFGRLKSAREFSRRAVDSAMRAGFTETAALWRVKAALREAEFGENKEAKRGVSEALKLAQGRDVKVLGALTLARIGDFTQAQELLKQLEQSYPSSTHLKVYWFPVITAAVDLREGNLSKSFASLEIVAPYELAQPSPNETGTLYPPYLRGQAYLAADNGAAAAVEFQKLLDHPGIIANFETGALARLQLARAFALAGETTKARTRYQDFLNLWKEADADIPILTAAKSEYAKLH